MYNEVQKIEYINSKNISASTRILLLKIFRWFEPYETKWGADLITQPAEVLEPVVNELTGLRKKSSVLIYSMLVDYANWSKRRGYVVNDGIFNIAIDNKDKIRRQMVSSPEALYELMRRKTLTYKGKEYEHGFDSPEKETIDITYRVFLWMAFSGLKDTEAINVATDNVDISKRQIIFNGNIYKIYEESIRDFEKACVLDRFLYEHPLYKTFKSRAPGNLIMRGLNSPIPNLQTIRPIIQKRLCIDEIKEKTSYNRIRLSGVFYRAYMQEIMGEPVDFLPIIRERMKNKQYKQSPTHTLNAIANRYCLELKEDYTEWKATFYPHFD